jgi:hypothetical protein
VVKVMLAKVIEGLGILHDICAPAASLRVAITNPWAEWLLEMKVGAFQSGILLGWMKVDEAEEEFPGLSEGFMGSGLAGLEKFAGGQRTFASPDVIEDTGTHWVPDLARLST